MTLVKVNNPVAKSLDGFFQDFFPEFSPAFNRGFRSDWNAIPPVNILEKGNAYQLELVAAGFQKSDFNIHLEGNLLTIHAETKEAVKDEQAKQIRREFQLKSFKRSFTLDDKIDAAGIVARYENGVLLVTLPKKEADQIAPKQISIQ